MDSNTWDTLEHFIERQDGPGLADLLKDLIENNEIEQLDKNEVLNQVVSKDNPDFLTAVAPHFDFAIDDHLPFQMALYNGLNKVALQLAPPRPMWERVIDSLRMDAYYSCLNRWSDLAQDNLLDATILEKIKPDFYSSDAQEAIAAIEERMSVRTTRVNLTEALQGVTPTLRITKKM